MDYISSASNSTVELNIVVQPAEVQIVGYNISPSIVVSISKPLEQDLSITAHLIEYNSSLIIDQGLPVGNFQILKKGTTSTKFVGLKLAKMKTLAEFLKRMKLAVKKPYQFAIKFTWQFSKEEPTSMYTTPFEVYSNVNQLAPYQKLTLRPNPRSFFPSKSSTFGGNSQSAPASNNVGPSQPNTL